MRYIVNLFIMLIVCFAVLVVRADDFTATKNYFQQSQQKPNQLLIFLQQMPKGGILHSHLTGAVFAEDLVQLAADENFCFNPTTQKAYLNPNCDSKLQFKNILTEPKLYNTVLDAWSMRNFNFVTQNPKPHFYSTFEGFGEVSFRSRGQILADILKTAQAQEVIYLEIMSNPDNMQATTITKGLKWTDDFTTLRQELIKRGIKKIATDASEQFNQMLTTKDKMLNCDGKKPLPACHIPVNFIYQIVRDQQPVDFFAQALEAFVVAQKNPHVVGITLVGDESDYLALKDYHLQMTVIAYLHKLYPNVHIDLHAGELNPNKVTPAQLSNHIDEAVNIADSQRIGHGVDIAYEKNAPALLNEMAKKKILVEINLSSNAESLGTTAKQEPLKLYLSYDVPVVLSTDDGGILRTDMSREFQRAVLTYDLSYSTIKQMVRNSITYSFLPGESLWQDADKALPVAACAQEALGSSSPALACQQFLSASTKAKMQWRLESQLAAFEAKMAAIAQQRSAQTSINYIPKAFQF